MQSYAYASVIAEEDGDFVVSVRDLPQVVTSGSTCNEAYDLAVDAITAVVETLIDRGLDVPAPSALQPGEVLVPLSPQLAAKAAVYSLWREAGMSKSELARRMGRNEVEVRRILDPHHGTKLDQLDEAARALGGRLVIGVEARA